MATTINFYDEIDAYRILDKRDSCNHKLDGLSCDFVINSMTKRPTARP
jgi:hypothetical protein